MLTLLAPSSRSRLTDEALPVDVKELPEDLAALDLLLTDHEVSWPLVERWRAGVSETGRLVLSDGAPDDPLETLCG